MTDHRDALLDMLKRLQWDEFACCPICGKDRMYGHAPDCELKKLLEER